MRHIIEVLRLKHEARLSHARIAAACGLSKGVVGKYVSLAQAHGIGWPLPEGTDEAGLEALLFPARTPPACFAEPDYFQIHQELKRKGVTLQLLWAEYIENHGDHGYRYSQRNSRVRSCVLPESTLVEAKNKTLSSVLPAGGPGSRSGPRHQTG
jgi:hypothetical protein